jgi:uncharacterized protein YndB with AHSA1/START domain
MADNIRAGDAIDLRDAGPMIVATVRLPDCTPERALSAFTDPAVLARWWRGELAAELVAGGEYSVWFAAIPARLTGRVIAWLPGSSLSFSWAWEGDDGPASTVTVTASRVGRADAQLMIEHGPHGEDQAGQAAHGEHLAGWEFFLPRLPAAIRTPAT